jgi:hypothetical protein
MPKLPPAGFIVGGMPPLSGGADEAAGKRTTATPTLLTKIKKHDAED